MAAVVVWERMDGDQAVVEPDGEFVGLVRAVLDPCLSVVDKFADRSRNSVQVVASRCKGKLQAKACLLSTSDAYDEEGR